MERTLIEFRISNGHHITRVGALTTENPHLVIHLRVENRHSRWVVAHVPTTWAVASFDEISDALRFVDAVSNRADWSRHPGQAGISAVCDALALLGRPPSLDAVHG